MQRPPILFIHGAFSQARHFAGWVTLFSKAGYECHAPSLPAHGPSDPAALSSLTISDYLAALKKELIKLPAAPVIIGHSMGGLLAQHLAATAPCHALVCVASAPPWRLSAKWRALPHLLPFMPTIITGRPVIPPEAMVGDLALHDLPENERRELLPTFGAESGRAYRAMIRFVQLPGARFRGPVLCLSGGQDRLIPKLTSRTLARY